MWHSPARSGWGVGGMATLSLDRAALWVLVSPPPRGGRELLFTGGVEQYRGGRGMWVEAGILFFRWKR